MLNLGLERSARLTLNEIDILAIGAPSVTVPRSYVPLTLLGRRIISCFRNSCSLIFLVVGITEAGITGLAMGISCCSGGVTKNRRGMGESWSGDVGGGTEAPGKRRRGMDAVESGVPV